MPVEAGPVRPETAGAAVPVDAKAVATGAAKPAARRAAARSTPRKAPAAATPRKAAGPVAPAVVPPLRPTTLAIDVGGTGLKASVLDAAGKLVADRVRVLTQYPCTPKDFVDALSGLVAPLPDFDRVSVGFNGVVRKGIVLTAPHFVTRSGAAGSASGTQTVGRVDWLRSCCPRWRQGSAARYASPMTRTSRDWRS